MSYIFGYTGGSGVFRGSTDYTPPQKTGSEKNISEDKKIRIEEILKKIDGESCRIADYRFWAGAFVTEVRLLFTDEELIARGLERGNKNECTM